MFQTTQYSGSNKDNFALVLAQAKALISDEPDMIANMANLSSLLYHFLDDVNWAGFYLYKEDQLVLGPFQGKSACTRIPLHKGVCGAAASNRKTMHIDDVHAFPGHIACDAASQSEVVVPILYNNQLIGVLDIDAPIPARFSSDDVAFLEAIVAVLITSFS
ncbi:MAG: GAF domain-containing protein [Erysipelotrichaceae bacterium]